MPPNILWIVTTQWRLQALGHEGDPHAHTPCIDRLAAESVRFTQAATPHPFGPFARAALLTGKTCPANGLKGYFDPLPVGSRTVAHRMAEAGYATAFLGKWHLAERDPSEPLVGEAHARTAVPEDRRGGFGFWEGFESGFLINDPWLQGTRLPEPMRFAGYQSDVLCARALDYLSGLSSPWFAVLSLEPPHPPYHAPASGIAPADPATILLRRNVPDDPQVRARALHELSGYYSHIEATDRAIGRLVSSLARSTSIVFTSVHGDMHGSHGKFRKGWPHEESVRVPLLVRDGSPPSVCEHPISLADLPRLNEALARCETAVAFAQGLPPAVEISMPSVVALPDQCDRVWSGVRTRERKVVLNDDGSPWLVHDLQADPMESENLAGTRRAEVIAAELGLSLTPPKAV